MSWKSKKQKTISLSSVEAEYKSLRRVVGELIWLLRLFSELIVPLVCPFSVFCDSQFALLIAQNSIFHERTKHIEIVCHFVRTKLQEGLITLHYVHNDHQLADILTKTLTLYCSR